MPREINRTHTRIAMLSSYTADLVVDAAKQSLAGHPSLHCEWFVSPFNQYHQQVLDPRSDLHRFRPDVVVVSIDEQTLLNDVVGALDLIAATSRQFQAGTILAHNFVHSLHLPQGFQAWNQPDSLRTKVSEANRSLSKLALERQNLYILDLEQVALRKGLESLHDPRLWYLAKMPFSSAGAEIIGGHIGRAIAATLGVRKKCLVLDLDDTLWGGILGEQGAENLVLSDDGPGKAYYDFQQVLLNLQKSGTLLALCSKNDEGPARQVLAEHPYMVLRQEHFAAIRINWNPKPENILSISDEINLGLDSMVFIDDSPHEREAVHELLPGVVTPEMPADAAQRPLFLAELPYFDTFSITREDQERGHAYFQERQRSETRASLPSLDDYLKNLATKLTVAKETDFSIPRIAQLTQKTNQFNLTTHRYSEAQIRDLASDPAWDTYTASARDRIGDAGIIGVALVHRIETEARLDTFLVSCRVLGRNIEEGFLAAVLELARTRGVTRFHAEYIPTPKNSMAKDFLTDNGFTPAASGSYTRSLSEPTPFPKWIDVVYEQE